MKAIQLEKPRAFRAIDIVEPAMPGAGEVLLRIHRVGICGTDYGGFLGKMPFYSYPRIPGHELGVEVLAIGEGVDNVRPGDRCSVEPYMNCQRCYACRRGLTNCCESNVTLGVMCDGGLRERMILPARKLHLASTLSYEQLALVETLAIGCHAVARGGVKAGDNVLVIGAGPIGLSAIEFVKVTGANCTVLDVLESRLAFCRNILRVPYTILARDDGSALKTLKDITHGQLADVVIDATGNSTSMSQALNYCAIGGRLVYVGITQHELSLPHAPALHRRELTILGSRNALSGDFDRIIRLIEGGMVDTKPWITHRGTFDTLIGDFPMWLKPETGVIKAIVAIA